MIFFKCLGFVNPIAVKKSDNISYKFCRYILNVQYENNLPVKIVDIVYTVDNLL